MKDVVKGSKAILIVNMGGTGSGTDALYKALQELYDAYSKRGLQILAFPSSQFLGKDLILESDVNH